MLSTSFDVFVTQESMWVYGAFPTLIFYLSASKSPPLLNQLQWQKGASAHVLNPRLEISVTAVGSVSCQCIASTQAFSSSTVRTHVEEEEDRDKSNHPEAGSSHQLSSFSKRWSRS